MPHRKETSEREDSKTCDRDSAELLIRAKLLNDRAIGAADRCPNGGEALAIAEIEVKSKRLGG